jgi:hypothetical protein
MDYLEGESISQSKTPKEEKGSLTTLAFSTRNKLKLFSYRKKSKILSNDLEEPPKEKPIYKVRYRD